MNPSYGVYLWWIGVVRLYAVFVGIDREQRA